MPSDTFENPLIPNQRLKQLYNDMRLLRLQVKKTRGLEAGIAATATHLRPQDTIAAGSVAEAVHVVQQSSGNLLPATLDAAQQFDAAHGAAFANKHFTPGSIAMVFLNEALPATYGKLIQVTAQRDLPILYVQLPGHKPHPAVVRNKIPVIPVDVTDAIACYRVAQEAFTRARTLSLSTWVSLVHVDREDPIDKMKLNLRERGLLSK